MNTLITVLGWEERFYRGTEISIEKYEVDHVLLITFIDYLQVKNMEENRGRIEKLATDNGISLEHVELSYSDSISNWRKIDSIFNEKEFTGAVTLNITTIPRETIWMLLFFLKKAVSAVNYIYFKPIDYCEDWLTKNHKNPRLLFKHSGVFGLDKPLALFIITGFDGSRLDSLIDYYEPAKVLVFSQNGNQFNNDKRNNGLKFNRLIDIQKIELDSYNVEESTEILTAQINKHSEYNIIISSQGPKLSSLSTYKNYQLSDGRVGLAYVPAKEFNENYSVGIDENYVAGEFIL